MTPENRRPQTPVTKELHPGIIPVEEGGERPHLEGTPSIQDINTGEIPTLLPDHSGKLVLTNEERNSDEFQQKTDALRAYHQERTSVETTPAYPDYEPRGSIDTTKDLDDVETDDEPVRKSKLKKALFYASTGAALITTLLVGGKVIADKSEKPSELDIWNQSRPTATAPLSVESTETAKPIDLKAPLGENSDMTYGEAFNIGFELYSSISSEKIYQALSQANQAEVDTIRSAVKGELAPGAITKILQKYGLETTDWL